MTDYLQSILTGFFTGIGVVTANWFHEKYVKLHLENISKKIEIKGDVKND